MSPKPGAALIFAEDFIDTDRDIVTLDLPIADDELTPSSLINLVADIATTARGLSSQARAATTACVRRIQGRDDGARAG